MGHQGRRGGFSILELIIALAIIGVFAGMATVLMSGSFSSSRARAAVRSVADLMMLARTEAIRTGDNHIVFFFLDAQDSSLTGPDGEPAAALLIRDLDSDGRVDSGERVASVLLEDAGDLSWGSALAANLGTPKKAPNDNPAATFPEPDADFLCCTFVTSAGDEARWLVFLPDGTPRGFKIGPFEVGDVTSGNGAVYVTSGERDYAAVLAPLGGVRVHSFDVTSEEWTQ